MIARMWEARCTPGRTHEVVAWLTTTVVPEAYAKGCAGAEVFRAEDRAVLVTRWQQDGWTEPEPPAGCVQRAHAWPFEVMA